MELKIFAGQKKSELSMIEVAHAILETRGEAMAFADIVNEIQNYLDTSDAEIRGRLGQFYTDLNMDGSFISLGENVWGLREWYSYESVDEEVNHPEDDEERPRKKRRRKVNAFLADTADDDDVIDYSDDDPEDDDLDATEDDDDDETDEIEPSPVTKKFKETITDIDSDDDDDDSELDDGIEGQLSEFNDDELVDTDGADFSSDDDDDSTDSDDDDDDTEK